MNESNVLEFGVKVLGDIAGGVATFLAAIGDRLGLFKCLAANGPATSADLAARASINERYAREWLGAMAAAGYVTYDRDTGQFAMRPEHAPVLAEESSIYFVGGTYELFGAAPLVLEPLVESFRNGGGVPQSAYPASTWSGMERLSAGMFENQFVSELIPSAPGVRESLERGVDVADVGCGSGRALITLARAFPRSLYTGYDVSPAQVEKARAAVQGAGLADRVRIEQRDVTQGLSGSYDIITTFDVVHDAVSPADLLRAIRQALRPGGHYLCLEINCSDKIEENVGPLAVIFYGLSIMYCMTTSLAEGGVGLGTLGVPEQKLRELGADAGFSSVDRLPYANLFNVLYVLHP